MLLTLFIQAFHLAISLTQQALDRSGTFKSLVTQGINYRTDHPPQLEHRLHGGHLLQLLSSTRHDFQILVNTFALDPSQQTKLKACTHLACPERDAHDRLTRGGCYWIRLLV